ncbi:MAG: sulfotransferase [Maricaulaceae bacterium]
MNELLLIGIGTQKAGTTWLSEYFRKHQPLVHQPQLKEVHFFDNYFMPKYGQFFEEQRLRGLQQSIQALDIVSVKNADKLKDLTAQLRRFSAILSPHDYLDFLRDGAASANILCDITPDYTLLGASAFEFMKQVHPNVKLMFLMRNPADRFWSSLRFNRTHNPNFDILENFDQMLYRDDFVRYVNYDRTLCAAFEHFSKPDVFTEFYENLFTDAAITKLCSWLKLPFQCGDYEVRSNEAQSEPLPENLRQKIVIAYARTYQEISDRFGYTNLPKNWRTDMEAYL